jgi:hypothetical protein
MDPQAVDRGGAERESQDCGCEQAEEQSFHAAILSKRTAVSYPMSPRSGPEAIEMCADDGVARACSRFETLPIEHLHATVPVGDQAGVL